LVHQTFVIFENKITTLM